MIRINNAVNKSNGRQLEKKTDRTLLFIGIILSISILALLSFLFGAQKEPYLAVSGYKQVNISCTSNSMGLTINCGDTLIFDPDVTNVEIGDIYVFKYKGHNVVHRLVYCVDVDCNTLVFKGDENKFPEVITRDMILGKVVSVEY